MAPVARTPCQKVAPLLARFNDPDLTEADRVLLSMHLLRCPTCLARIQEYRAIDGRIRGMAATTVAPRVRDAVLQQIALTGAVQVGQSLAQPWRHTWSGLALAFSLATLLFAAGAAHTFAAQRTDLYAAMSAPPSNGIVRPLALNLLNVAPTSVSTASARADGDQNMAFRHPVLQVQPTRPVAVGATIRLVNLSEGRIVVTVAGAHADERLTVLRDTAIVLPGGRPGDLGDLAVGAQVQLQREMLGTGGIIAREIVVSR